MRYDLAFFLCCCKSFLGSKETDDAQNESFYDLLQVEPNATPDEIKRAYKRQSLQMHPDKLAQRGLTVTDLDQARFARMKDAYEVLSDPHKRETYDAIGERGMKWIDEPFSLDPQELARNFAQSSVIDRSKIFGIFVGLAVLIFWLPVMICLMMDGTFGSNAKWTAVLTPLWLWDAFILFYHSRVIVMGPIKRPDHIPEEEWIDPLPMSKRIFSLVRFGLIVLFELLTALKLDGVLPGWWKWYAVFVPLYLWEATTLYKKLPAARMRIVTVDDLETALGKPFSEFTPSERELIGKRYTVVPSVTSPQYEAAHKLKTRARQDILKLLFRVTFMAFVLIELDTSLSWNWWLVFLPFWIMSFAVCCGHCYAFVEVHAHAAERDPDSFGKMPVKPPGMGGDKAVDVEMGAYSSMKEGGSKPAEADGKGTSSTGGAGATTAAATSSSGGAGPSSEPPKKKMEQPPLTDAERDELKAQVLQSGSRMIGTCCIQAFILLIVGLFVGKLQGASYSSMWVLSPLLIVAGIVLCCLGCTIFCVTEVNDDAMEYDTHLNGNVAGQHPGTAGTTGSAGAAGAGMNGAGPNKMNVNYVPPSVPLSNKTTSGSVSSSSQSFRRTGRSYNGNREEPEPPKSTWDPEKGQVWLDQPTTTPSPPPPPPPNFSSSGTSTSVSRLSSAVSSSSAASGRAGTMDSSSSAAAAGAPGGTSAAAPAQPTTQTAAAPIDLLDSNSNNPPDRPEDAQESPSYDLD